ncbi:hypothetical protein BGZ79_010626 [Entomortierella chlamydospora]|nr:hypothetical protein BGZ79_010626 [Entomortierella chlamydospora]
MPDQSAALVPRPIVAQGDGLLNIATTEPSLAINSMSVHRYPGYQPLLPVKESPLAPKVEPRTKFDLSISSFPGKTRKRHKVATSCNRCRQNKRKCDSGIPCSNCKRNKADCLYTDAQQSRSTWGDSPLSKEKIIGVSTADLDKDTQSPVSQPAASSPSSPAASKTSKAQTKPSSASKKSTTSNGLSVPGKGSVSQTTSQPVPFSTATLQFNPGHASSEQGSILDKRREMLAAQSIQIAKAIRVAKPGPQLDLSGLLLNESISTAIPNHRQPTHATQNVPSIGPESSQTGLSGVVTNLTSSAIHNLPSQSAPRTAWQQDPGVGQVSSPPQSMFNGPQIRQTSLDQQVGSTRSPSTQPLSPYSDTLKQEHSPFTIGNNTNQPNTTYSHQISNQSMSPQQQFPLSYAENGVSEAEGSNRASTTITVSSFVPTQNGLNTISQGIGGGSHTSFSAYQRNPSSIGSEVGGSLAHEQHRIYQQQYEPQQQHNMGTMSSNAVVLLQDHQPSSVAQFDLNHAISSAAPVSPTVMSSQPRAFSPLNNTTPLYKHQNQVEWKDSNLTRLPSGYPGLHSVLQNASAALPQSTATAYAPIIDTRSTVEQGQVLPSQDSQSEERIEVARMQRIAKSMIDCKNYDHSILLPRHISQEHDEMWVVPHSNPANDLQGMPRQLLVLPKDANYLVDVFFEHSYYYYPIVNRAVVESHLMEPQTPHSLFLLNIVFMAACKHLARNSDIKRAIQFRERAHEIQPYIDVRVRISMIQGAILGAQVTYGVFHPVLGVTQMFGSRETFTSFPDGAEEKGKEGEQEGELKIDLAAESRSILANKNLIPESVYQQRLWTFWGLYARDCMAKLYFGWPYGLDGMDFSPELPKIKGTVGLGGMKRNSSGQNGLDGQVTGKRRGAAMNMQQLRREKKLMKAEKAALAVSHNAYRMSSFNSDDDEDEEDELEDQEDESDTEQDDFDVLSSVDTKTRADVTDKNQRSKWTEDSRNNNNNNSAGTSSQSKENTISFSGLSKPLLEKQSRGEDLSRRQGSGSRSADIKRHLERMKLLLDAESDVTDGGTYSRVLFLEEIKLWTIGRRVGLYLQGRDTSLSVSPAAAATAFGSPYGLQRSVPEGSDPFTSTISTSLEASKCSERAWLEDKELQGLQADLIAWEQALPPIFKFRSDVDADDINHKLNGKLGIITMYYYTITILLQSSYLPIPQYLSSPSRSSPSRSAMIKSPESLSQEYDGMFSRAASLACSDDSGPRIKSETEEYFYTGRSPQPSSNGYFNTAHQICTQLSNVVYHHVELLLDRYQEWCTIQAKLNHTLTAALRVSCLNARLSSNSRTIRDEAKAGFKMGSELFKRQATIPAPLTIRDWPAEEDVMKFKDLEEGFRELMTTQDDEEAAMEEARSRSQTRDSEGLLWGDDPGDHLLYSPDFPDVTGTDVDPYLQHGLGSLDAISSHYDMFRAEHVFGLSDEGFQFDYNVDA